MTKMLPRHQTILPSCLTMHAYRISLFGQSMGQHIHKGHSNSVLVLLGRKHSGMNNHLAIVILQVHYTEQLRLNPTDHYPN